MSGEQAAPDGRSTAGDGQIVIVPGGAWHTSAFRRLRITLWVWLVAAGVAASATRSLPLFIAAVVPLVILVLPPAVLRPLPRRLALIEPDPPRVELDRGGMTLHWPRGTVNRWNWDEIETLEVDRLCRGTLLGRDGRRLSLIHPSFVRPRTGWFVMPSLALRVVELCPERFVTSRPANRLSQPYGFLRRTPGHVPPDTRAIRRRQAILQAAALLVLIAAAAAVLAPFPLTLPG